MSAARALLLVVTVAAGTGCPWHGVTDLVNTATLEVVVTGVATGDRLRLSLDDRVSSYIVPAEAGDRVSLYDDLPPGEHDGLLVLQRGEEDDRCAELEVTTVAGERRSLAIDVSQLMPCDDEEEEEDAGPDDPPESDAGPPAAPELERIRELVRDETCVPEPCETEIRVEGGLVDVHDVEEELTGELTPAAWAALSALVLSPAADTLFAGDDPSCPLASPPAGPAVELERRTLRNENEETRVTERLDVTGCGGVAAEIRAALADARTVATTPGE